MQNNFFGSKLNTALLLILIILMVVALKWMSQNKEMYLSDVNLNTEVNEYKDIIRANYSFKSPKNWQESSLNFEGCDWYSISNDTSDGHRIAGEIGIYPTSCFDITKSNGKQDVTTKDNYYIISYYDDNTTPLEISEVKEVYKRIVDTFEVK